MATAATAKKKKKKMGRGRRLATGVDIGTYSVKLVTLVGDDAGQLDVKKVTVVPLEPSANGAAPELYDRQKSALKDALKQHGKPEGRVVLGCPRDVIMVRYLTLPSGNPLELREMLFYDVERHVPFPVDDLEVSYQIVEKLGEHESRVMMVCVPKKELEPYMRMLQELAIEIHSIVPDVMADTAAYARTLMPFETVALVNFGRSAVNLAIVKEGQLLFSRSLSTSEEELLRGFPRARGWKDLQGRVTVAGVQNPREREHFTQWVEHLGLELVRSVSAFICEAGEGSKIDRLVMCGGAGFFPAGPPRGLALKLRTKVTIEAPMNGELPANSKFNGTELATAIGLALWGLNAAPDHLNLLPEAFVQERIGEQKSTFRKNIATMLLLILLLVGGAGFVAWREQYLDRMNVLAYYEALRQETAQLEKMRKKIETLENYIDNDKACLNVIKSVLEVMPPKCYINNMTFTKRKSLEINGQVLTDEDYLKMLNALNALKSPRGEPFFDNIRPTESNVALDLGTTSIQVKEFGLTCKLHWNEEKDKRKSSR